MYIFSDVGMEAYIPASVRMCSGGWQSTEAVKAPNIPAAEAHWSLSIKRNVLISLLP